MATRTENEDNNVPLFQFEVSLKKKISIRVTHLAISQTATFLSIVQLYPGLYMNNRTWIKKIREQHQFISLVKVVICWLQECVVDSLVNFILLRELWDAFCAL